MFQDYNDKVNFYYVYSNIQHFETNGIVAPYSIAEKMMHIAEAKRRTGSSIPWICDTMDNQLKKALHASPNAEFVIGPNGKVIKKRFWSDPSTLRSDLENIIGAIANPTKVENVKARFKNESRKIASGVIPRLKLPKRLSPVIVEPQATEDGAPFFVKLRAESDFHLISKNKGQLYLAFHVDPLHKVHWNNQSGQFRVKLHDASGVKFDQLEMVSPKVAEPSDIDPREFLIDVEFKDEPKPIELTAQFTVCDDAETFCLPVKQRFKINVKRDEYGGTRPGIFLESLFSEVEKMDKNKDGCLTNDELPPGKVTLYIGHMDKNENGKIDAEEISEFKAMFGNGKGFGK